MEQNRNAAFMNRNPLLTRDEFRNAVFERDGHKCVMCGSKADTNIRLDAHHIIERRLFSDGGYYLANGATLCDRDDGLDGCHMMAERTLPGYSVEDVRNAAGIRDIIVPDHMYADHQYDKWGNSILPSGKRTRGELFYDESVQKVLSRVISADAGLFTDYVKYPRTMHCTWSQSVNDDDRMLKNMSAFVGQRVIVTEKMDGENTSIYRDYIHARSIDGRSHKSRDWVKQFASTFQHDIPQGWRVTAENLYAKHSIAYDELPSYCMGFGVWDNTNVCQSWDDTVEWFSLLGITSVPVLFDGMYDEKAIRELWNDSMWQRSEGYVIRLADRFPYAKFRHSVAKFVRNNHVQTQKHWMHGQEIIPNGMRAYV